MSAILARLIGRHELVPPSPTVVQSAARVVTTRMHVGSHGSSVSWTTTYSRSSFTRSENTNDMTDWASSTDTDASTSISYVTRTPIAHWQHTLRSSSSDSFYRSRRQSFTGSDNTNSYTSGPQLHSHLHENIETRLATTE